MANLDGMLTAHAVCEAKGPLKLTKLVNVQGATLLLCDFDGHTLTITLTPGETHLIRTALSAFQDFPELREYSLTAANDAPLTYKAGH